MVDALVLLADGGAALVLLADGGAALVLLADGGAALVLLADGGAALVLLAVCANARCENCIPTMVKDVRSIAEIAIADSVVTFAYVFLCIRPQGLGMKFICFLPLIKKTASVIFYTRFTYFCKILGLANILYASFLTASI